MSAHSANASPTAPVIWLGQMPKRSARPPMKPVATSGVTGLYKLVLVVAQACNLKCTYCYAEGGPYGPDVRLMSQDTARHAVRTMFRKHSPISTLQFFGGEPSLNLTAMTAAVDEVRALTKDEAYKAPRFSIVTNAARLTSDLLDFYIDTNMKLTVSHDGPRDVHDALRPTTSGEGSFDRVEETLDALAAAKLDYDIQCTYTAAHARAGYGIVDLLEYYVQRGASKVNIVPVAVPRGDSLDVFYSDVFNAMVDGYREGIRWAFARFQRDGVSRFGMLSESLSLISKERASPHYCNAGVSTLTVAADGEVYPCFMFINKEGFRLGDVRGEHHLASFSRPDGHIDVGCPGRQFMMQGEVAVFRPDELLKQAVIDTLLDCITGALDEVEAAMSTS